MDAPTSKGPIPQILKGGIIGMGNWRIKRGDDCAIAWHVRQPDRVITFDDVKSAMDHAREAGSA